MYVHEYYEYRIRSISSHSQIEAAPPDVLNKIVAALKY